MNIVRIDRAIDDVFSFVTSPEHLSAWDPRVVEARVEGGGPVREGSRIREVRRLGPRRVEQVVQVAALDRPKRFALRIVDGPFPVHGDLRFEPSGSGTVVTLLAHGTAPGPGFLAPAVTALARRQMRAQYSRLKRVLEDGGNGAMPST